MPVLFNEALQLLPAECIACFVHLSPYLDANPRRIKRILNVFQVAHGIAQLWPLQEADPSATVVSHEHWPAFRSKLIKWICLCEMFP